MNGKRTIHIVGAGASGLLLAYRQACRGLKVHVYERKAAPGGMIATKKLPYGLVETAASAFVPSLELERLAEEIGLELVPAKKESAKRFFYRQGRLRRWPLGLRESLSFLKFLVLALFFRKAVAPKPQESLHAWGIRVMGEAPTRYLLSPALSGIYAGDPERLSASLIMGRFFGAAEVSRKGKYRGSLAAREGMGGFILALEKACRERGVEFHYGEEPPEKPDCICTNAADASRILARDLDPRAEILRRVEMLPLMSVTVFFPENVRSIEGFGVLFPRDGNFRALGVLMNHSIFPGRTELRSETWIYGGAAHPELLGESDEAVEELLLRERAVLMGERARPLHLEITRWPEAIPHYDIRLEKVCEELKEYPQAPRLFGNYLGGIGLTKLVEASGRLEL